MLLALLMLMSGFSGQDTSSQALPRPLKSSTSHLLQVPTFGAYGEPQCDDKMSMYYHLAAGPYVRTTLLRVAASGEESTLYKLPDEFDGYSFMDFSVTPAGTVTALTEDKKGHAVVFEFNSEGNVNSHTQLELPDGVAGERIAVFPNGTMLFSGAYQAEGPARPAWQKICGPVSGVGQAFQAS